MPSSTSNFERVIVNRPWGGIGFATLVIVLALGIGWELRVRSQGYGPTLNDTSDLWAEWRDRVEPDSIVLIGASRMLFDMDLDVLERSLGKRPIQLALVGSCAYVNLADLADDESFRGTVICDMVSHMFFAPGGRLLENAEMAIRRRKTQSPSQFFSHKVSMLLEERIAFLKQQDLTLPQLLRRLPISNRSGALVPPPLPPYFRTTDRDRQARMTDLCEKPGPLQDRVKYGWLPLFTPPPPPTWIPPEQFGAAMGAAVEKRFADTAEKVAKIRARGGKVVFVAFPRSGPLPEIEEKAAPRVAFWDRVLRETSAPGINYADYPELSGFECPEWSHLSASDSVEFTKRLLPHLKRALAESQPAG